MRENATLSRPRPGAARKSLIGGGRLRSVAAKQSRFGGSAGQPAPGIASRAIKEREAEHE